MAISTLPNYTLPASQFLASITTFVNQLRFKDTLKATSMVRDFVDRCKVGKVDSGKGIVFTFKKSLQPVNNLSTTSSVLTITPPTGLEDKRIIYITAGVVGLSLIGVGIFIIKKKII